MEYTVEKTQQGLKIELSGELTFEKYQTFRAVIEEIRTEKTDVEFSLSTLENIDSAGAGMMKLAKDEAKRLGISFSITNIPKDLQAFISLLDT